MKFETILILILAYFFFVYQGIRKQYRLDVIGDIADKLGIERKNFFSSTFELFKIGIGVEEPSEFGGL